MDDKTQDYAVRMTLTPSEACIVTTALDFFIRIGLGQLDEIQYNALNSHPQSDPDNVHAALVNLKSAIFGNKLPYNASFSIRNCPDNRLKIAYDILAAARYRMHHAPGNPAGGSVSVWGEKPLYITDHRPHVEIVGVLDQLAEAAGKSDIDG